jgi:hypothetical protein
VREKFFEREREIAKAFAYRLGVDEDDLTAHVLAGAVNAAVWSAVNSWVAAGAGPDRLLPSVDEAFAVLGVTTSATAPTGAGLAPEETTGRRRDSD